MKKYFLVILSFVFLFSACKDLLNTYPADQIATENMWTNEALADQGMNGLYENNYIINMEPERISIGSSSEGFLKQQWIGMEFQSVNTKNGIETLRFATKSPSDKAVVREWKWYYTGIHRINDALENLYKAGLSTEKYERYMCEAKFLRAWHYSRLNMIYQGVPLYLRVISESECTQGQATSAEVWEAVLNDLNDCIDSEYFPDNTLSSTNYGRPSKGAAYSLRGMAYMWLAWENNEDTDYYQLAADDFLKVSECGYGLWAGSYIDFFNHDNERDHEMIYPIQFTQDSGYSDMFQILLGAYDQYGGWSGSRPATDFVNYYQNADGTDFDFTSRIPEWNDEVFLNDPNKREVFFFRDSVSLDSSGNVISDYWDESETAKLQERVNVIGADIFNKYYLKDGNEDRLRTVYNDRDPRLKQSILTPYEPYDAYRSEYYNGNLQEGKEKRWPYLGGFGPGKDFYVGVGPGEDMYAWKKYVYHYPDDLPARDRFDTDWPLIRYTDIYLYLAECYVHTGNLSGAVSIVNEIRSRAGMPSISVGTADQVMEAIRYERRVELCTEGVDYFDEIRWGTYKEMKFQGKDVYGVQNYWGQWENYSFTWYYTDDMYPWGPPLEETQRNPNLKKREGWAY